MIEGFKNTVAGLIPNNWEVKELGEIVDKFVNGGTPSTSKQEYWLGNIPWITGADILNQSIAVIRRHISQEAVKNSSTNVIEKGNILLVSRTGVGKVAIAPFDIAISQDFTGIYVNAETADPLYLFRYFDYAQNFLKAQNQGTSIQGITREALTSLPVPLPPTLSEQNAITTALNDVDTLINHLEQLLAKKRNIKAGTMQELLRPVEGWEELELKEIVKQFIVPMRDKPKKFSGDIPWCRIEDFEGKYLSTSKSNQCVDEKTISEMNLKVMPEETLIVSCSADLGRCAILKNALVTNQTFIGLVVDGTCSSNEFLYYYFIINADRLNNLSSGTTISYLSREQFENLKVIVPKSRAEQARIAQILSDMDNEIQELERKIAKYKMLKQGMMQALLTGKIRLVNSVGEISGKKSDGRIKPPIDGLSKDVKQRSVPDFT